MILFTIKLPSKLPKNLPKEPLLPLLLKLPFQLLIQTALNFTIQALPNPNLQTCITLQPRIFPVILTPSRVTRLRVNNQYIFQLAITIAIASTIRGAIFFDKQTLVWVMRMGFGISMVMTIVKSTLALVTFSFDRRIGGWTG